MADYTITMIIGVTLAGFVGVAFGALWGLSRHEWLYCRVTAYLLQRMQEAMESLNIDEWKIDKAQEYMGSAIIPPRVPMPAAPATGGKLSNKDSIGKVWSEEDKRKINRIYSILRQAADTHAFSTSCRLIGDKECIELQDFLKSLRPQKQWKPSGEQMKALGIAIRCGIQLGTWEEKALKDLIEQLKKLREE